jgi:hypothetical protein
VFRQVPEFDWLYICDKEHDPACRRTQCTCLNYLMKYEPKKREPGWLSVKNSHWTIDKILQKTVFASILNHEKNKVYATDGPARWQLSETSGLYLFYDELAKYNRTRFEYMKACLDASLDENVQLVEFRRYNFEDFGLFYFDEQLNRVNISAEQEVEMLLKFRDEYIRKNPQFIDFNFLIHGRRYRSRSEIRSYLMTSIRLQSKYPSFIRGFDLVGEEDKGYSLLFHIDALIDGFIYNHMSNGTYNYFFHSGETIWSDNTLAADDPVPAIENIYDSIIFRASRVGHGLGLVKRPDLYKYFIKNKIVVEVCPASNQILGNYGFFREVFY